MVKKDPQKNMTELLLRFEINEVWRNVQSLFILNLAYRNQTDNMRRSCLDGSQLFFVVVGFNHYL